MSEHDEAAEQSTPRRPAWRERAAFHVSVDYAADESGQLVWQTRAYHEESDTRSVWAGVPGAALIDWLLAVAALPESAPLPVAPAAPDPAAPDPAEAADAHPPTDDFKQIIGISAATERRLHEAGIRTYAQLAACSVADLSALLDIPSEKITRRGWITRARALAKLATIAGASRPALPEADTTSTSTPLSAGATLYVEVLFDEQGDVVERRMLSATDEVASPGNPEEGYVARCFVEAPADEGSILGEPAVAPSELQIEVDDVELEALAEAQPGEAGRLLARTHFRLVGLGAEQLVRERPRYLAPVLAYNLETGETKLLSCVGGQLDDEQREVLVEAQFELPEIGRYQILTAVLLASHQRLSAASGPRLRVNP
jgi:predicted flap endonuclease-1-like 5' DNA nuclease